MSPVERKILPASAKRVHETASPPRQELPKKRRTQHGVACDNCRVKKLACDRIRPSCTTCSAKSLHCGYITQNPDETPRKAIEGQLAQLQTRLKQHEDILQHLRSASESEALATIERLRATPNVAEVLSLIRSSPPPQRPSEHQAAQAHLPPTQSQLEFELMMLHGNVYGRLLSTDAETALNLSDIFRRRRGPTPAQVSTNSLLRSYEASSSEAMATTGNDDGGPQSLISGPPSALSGRPDRRISPLQGPLRARVYCDARLKHLEIAYWTKVPVSDEFAASMISVYLENEHPLVGAFDTETFLDDLVTPGLQFCSSFLVNSVLSLASQCYARLDQRAYPLSIAFMHEAETQWQGADTSDSVADLAAIVALSMATMSEGRDELSLSLVSSSRLMAERLCLLGVRHSNQVAQRFRFFSPKELRATAHAAWGCYAWLSVHASYYKEEPIKSPPLLPIPGSTNTDTNPAWPIHEQPAYIGQVFRAWCELWTIVQEVQTMYYQISPKPLHEGVSCAYLEEKYHKLLSWADAFSTDLICAEDSHHHLLVVHAYFHILILDLFRPFLETPESFRLKTFSSSDSSPRAVFDASFRQLQRLLVEYCSRCDPRFYNFYLNGAVLHISDVLFRDTNITNWAFYLALCMDWMKEVVTRYAVIGKAGQAHMSVGLAQGAITSDEARTFMEAIRRKGHHHDLAEIGLSCIIDFKAAMSSHVDGRAHELAERFDELALFDEFIILDSSSYKSSETSHD